MSSTNKTANYDLSQFVSTDKPAWLTDYNQDMSKIDAGIDDAKDTATAADGKATTNTTNIGDMSYLATTAKNTLVAAVNEVNSNANTAQNTATNASQTANNASQTANNAMAQISNFNLTNITTCTVTASNGNPNNATITVAKNSDGSLAKIYGEIWLTNLTATTTLTISDTGLRPEEPITFAGCALAERFDTNGTTSVYPLKYTLNTNGTVTMSTHGGGETTRSYVFLLADLLFIKDFGDTPVTPQP